MIGVPDFLGHDGHDKLMHTRAQQKCYEHGRVTAEMICRDGRRVYVPQEEGVYGLVPFAAKLIPRCAIPPVFIKLTVCKAAIRVRREQCLRRIDAL